MGDTAQTTTTRMYASIRDQLASEITAGVYPAGALLPSIREVMERWEVSTTTARKVLDELAAAGYARKEGTRGHISTGGPQPGPAPSPGEPARKAPPPAAVPGRLTVWPVHTIPAHGSIGPDVGNGLAALDVRAERPPADAAMALVITDPARQVIVRRRLAAAPDNTPVQFRVSYIPAELAESTPIAQSTAITDAWPAALTTYLGKPVRLASSQITARHPNHEEAAALALASDAAVLVREDIYEDRRGNPVDFTRTVWPGDTTRLVVGGLSEPARLFRVFRPSHGGRSCWDVTDGQGAPCRFRFRQRFCTLAAVVGAGWSDQPRRTSSSPRHVARILTVPEVAAPKRTRFSPRGP